MARAREVAECRASPVCTVAGTSVGNPTFGWAHGRQELEPLAADRGMPARKEARGASLKGGKAAGERGRQRRSLGGDSSHLN